MIKNECLHWHGRPGSSPGHRTRIPCRVAKNTDMTRDFPGVPVVKNCPSDARNKGSIPGQGFNIPHNLGQLSPCTEDPVQPKKKKKKYDYNIIGLPRWR